MQNKIRMEEVKHGAFRDAVHTKIKHSLGNSQFVLREKFDPQMHDVMDIMKELLCQMILKQRENFFFHLTIMISVTKDLPTLPKTFQATTLNSEQRVDRARTHT
jgi:hypothetical protein